MRAAGAAGVCCRGHGIFNSPEFRASIKARHTQSVRAGAKRPERSCCLPPPPLQVFFPSLTSRRAPPLRGGQCRLWLTAAPTTRRARTRSASRGNSALAPFVAVQTTASSSPCTRRNRATGNGSLRAALPHMQRDNHCVRFEMFV